MFRRWIEENPDKRAFNQSLHGYINIRFLSITETNQKAFIKMIELRYELEGVGTLKMMVGVKPSGEMIQYCITAMKT